MGRGHITTRVDLSDLLLDTRPFNSRPKSYGRLGWWDYHPLQQLFDDVDSLVCVLHYSFKLGLSTHHLSEININLISHFLISRPLGDPRPASDFGFRMADYEPSYESEFFEALWLSWWNKMLMRLLVGI